MIFNKDFFHQTRILFLLSGLLLFIIGCEKEQINTDLFTLHISDDIFTFQENYWLLIHDAEGDLLAFERMVLNDDLKIKLKERPATINITFLKLDRTGENDYYEIETFLGVKAGDEWFLEKSSRAPERNATRIGEVTVEIDHVPEETRVYLTNKWGYFGNEVFFTSEETSLSITNPLYEEARDLLLCAQPSKGIPTYHIFSDVNVGDNFQIDYTDLDEYDLIVNFSFAPTKNLYASVEALNNDPFYEQHGTHGFLTSIDWSRNNEIDYSSVHFGFLDQFARYRTEIFVDHYRYTQVGSRPLEIKIPETTFAIQDSSIQNFKLITSGPFEWRQSIWDYESDDVRINWNVKGSVTEQIPLKFPDSFASGHPLLDPGKLKYSYGVFYLQGHTFEDYLAKRFKRYIDTQPSYENWMVEY